MIASDGRGFCARLDDSLSQMCHRLTGRCRLDAMPHTRATCRLRLLSPGFFYCLLWVYVSLSSPAVCSWMLVSGSHQWAPHTPHPTPLPCVSLARATVLYFPLLITFLAAFYLYAQPRTTGTAACAAILDATLPTLPARMAAAMAAANGVASMAAAAANLMRLGSGSMPPLHCSLPHTTGIPCQFYLELPTRTMPANTLRAPSQRPLGLCFGFYTLSSWFL